MLDYFKLFFAAVHSLPPTLRYAFVFFFFTTAIVVSVAFKRWLENRQASKEVDLWACVPVELAVGQFLLWGLWSTASFYAVYVLEPTANGSAPSTAVAARPATATKAGHAATTAARSHTRAKKDVHAPASAAQRKAPALPDAAGARATDAVLAAEVVPGHKPAARARGRNAKAHTSPPVPVADAGLAELTPPPAQHAQGALQTEADSAAPAAPPQALVEPLAEPGDNLSQGLSRQAEPARPARKLRRKGKGPATVVKTVEPTTTAGPTDSQAAAATIAAPPIQLSGGAEPARAPASPDAAAPRPQAQGVSGPAREATQPGLP